MIWTWRYGTVHVDVLHDIAYDDQAGILYACGYTEGDFLDSLDADPKPDTKPRDAVVLALDAATRELVWLRSFTSGPLADRWDEALAITFDRNGVVHVSGNTNGKGIAACLACCCLLAVMVLLRLVLLLITPFV